MSLILIGMPVLIRLLHVVAVTNAVRHRVPMVPDVMHFSRADGAWCL
jgi:hypothetical protein